MSQPPAPLSAADTDVLVVGAGPTGLALACALAAAGVRTVVVDRQAEGANTSRAAVVHARTLEVLEPLGVADRLVALGLQASRFTIRDRDRILVPIDFDGLPSRYPYTLMVSQAVTESVLLKRARELGVAVRRPCSLVSFSQDEHGVDATLSDGSRVRARFLVGADGMHSAVRQQAGIGFDGGTYEESFVLADVRLDANAAVPQREVILFFSPAGMVVLAPLPDGVHRIVATVEDAPEQPDAGYVQALLDARGPQATRAVVRDVVWGSRFRVHHRIAQSYRQGRVLLAGDAAHVHSPAGGQGMNVGIQDGIDLADALLSALRGEDGALDAYGARRRPVAQQVVTLADRLTRMATAPRALRGVRNVLLALLARVPNFRRTLAWRLSGLVYRPAEV
jgi:2-polyprenyl-6-methoxyphenol hydroxylase-like FAD-dependent oxidoreductase